MGRHWLSAAGIIALLAMMAEAQIVYPGINPYQAFANPYNYVANPYNYVGGWGGINLGTNYLGSTPAESYYRGQSELLRAQGQAYRDAAQGAVDYENARTTYLANKQQWLRLRDERQAVYQKNKQEYLANQRATRQRRQNQIPQMSAESLLSSQYNRQTGQVIWPEALQTAPFTDERLELEKLLEMRVHTGESTSLDQQAFETTEAMLATLKNQIRNIPASDYIDAKRFLGLLADELNSSAS